MATSRTLWTENDNYAISIAVLQEYVIDRSQKPVGDFMNTLSLPTPHKRTSVRLKIQNTKYLLDSHHIPNTLPPSSRNHCSKVHREQFEKACRNLGIQI